MLKISHIALMIMIAQGAFATITPKEANDSIYCSLIESREDCNNNKNCVFVSLSFKKFYRQLENRLMCYNKQFIIRAMKARIFHQSYMGVQDAQLLKEANFDPNLDLNEPKNIVQLVTKLIELNKIDFMNSIELA